jgi:hypothetical protein
MIYHKEQFFYRRVAKAKKAGDAGRNSSQTKFVKTTGGGPGQAFLTEPDFEDLEEETASTGVSPFLTGMDPVMDMASVVHRQEALFWKVKREIMVAEALGRGIELPSSTRNNDGVAESRLLNGELDIVLRNIAKPENVIIFVHISFLGLGNTVL